MNCPKCSHQVSSVERTVRRAEAIVRTRQCLDCGHAWQTVESNDDKGSLMFDELDRLERVLKTAMCSLRRVL